MTNTREIILNILNESFDDFNFQKNTIENYLINIENQNDNRLIKETVYGIVKNLTLIDDIIDSYSKIKIKKLHKIVLNCLRIGVYQIIYLDRVPSYAIINDCVNLVKKYTHVGNAKFVNAILRNINSDKENIKESYSKLNLNYNTLALLYSFPDYIVKKWADDYGIEFTQQLLDSLNSKPKLNIRANTLKTTRDNLKGLLINRGYDLEETKYSSVGLVVHNPDNLFKTLEFINGYFTVQDESSMLVTEIADPKEKTLILDMCAAPGGKSTHIAEYLRDNATIIARDKSSNKVQLIKQNIERLNLKSIRTEIFDATKLDNELINKVDYCFVDAPCSGLGLIRRKPDIKWNRTIENIKELIELQSEILDVASKYVKIDGELIYSTCTINDDENIAQIKNFLITHPNYILVEFDNRFCELFNTAKDGYVQLFPNVHGTDGFFIAKLKRVV